MTHKVRDSQLLSLFQLRILATVGGALEFFDFTLFMLFSPWLAQAFFPEQSTLSGVMPVLLLFAAGHIVRPLGGFLFSHVGDCYGRKRVFLWTVVLMSFSTLGIGLLPGHAVLGEYAAVALLVLRLLQGLSLGGELPGSIVFASEHSPGSLRGGTAGLIVFGVTSGNLLGSLCGLLLNVWLPEEDLATWGWRLPFLLGGSLGFIGYKLRKNATETPVFEKAMQTKSLKKLPLLTVVHDVPWLLLKGSCIAMVPAIMISVFLFMPRYLAHYMGRTDMAAFSVTTSAFFMVCLIILGFSALSDCLGRKNLLIAGCVLLLLLAFVAFDFYDRGFISTFCFLAFLAIPTGIIMSSYEGALVELFATPVRNTGVAFCHNTAFAIFGGMTPVLLEQWCQSGYLWAPAVFISGGCLLMLAALLYVRDNTRCTLDQI
ncbi:Proline/betaine transporter [invertebrate metagenome]|uniref:Proline/betaine transporter n=1 Tax=invertebrate metagenome TaxID=1711999 RepID=A0A2H9T7A0_9ZZZZ